VLGFAAVKNALRAVLLMLLIAALPLRATASVTTVFCLAAGSDAPGQVHAHERNAGDHAGAHHGNEARKTGSDPVFGSGEELSGQLGHDCGFCAKHCSGSAYALATDAPRITAGAPAGPIPFGTLPAFGFFPEHPERPPLAL
jgi:hypothetical protein